MWAPVLLHGAYDFLVASVHDTHLTTAIWVIVTAFVLLLFITTAWGFIQLRHLRMVFAHSTLVVSRPPGPPRHELDLETTGKGTVAILTNPFALPFPTPTTTIGGGDGGDV